MGMEVLTVLADPVRLQIIEMLADGEHTAGQIAGAFPISGPAISRHLRVLREHDLVTCRCDAQRRIYALNPTPIVELEVWARDLLAPWRQRFDTLGCHLDALAEEEDS
jgi:DNA-binding transcriptional ArsR family regulator